MDARERFKHALVKIGYAQLLESGWNAFLFDDSLKRAREESGVSESDARRALQEMEGEYLVVEDGSHYRGTPFLALRYEEGDRAAAYAENEVRRRVLTEIIKVEDEHAGRGPITFGPDDEKEMGVPFPRLRAAARVLDGLSLIELSSSESNGYFNCRSTARGHDLYEDPAQMDAQLPTSAAHDENALLPIAPDALSEVIWSCKQLLEQRGWDRALQELEAGDREYADENWVNAVREYYNALESGLKYALTDAGATYSEGAALNKLATRAAEVGLIPVNYQAFFGFADSIRSPRSHGAGPKPVEIEVGQHEALLMGNHARTALLYLGGRRVSHPTTP
jgi:hypothetical protein